MGRRGPAGTAYMAIGDHWRWFGRVVAERKAREGDPIIVVLEQTLADTNAAIARHPGDTDLARLRDWLTTFLVFVRLFDRAVGLVSRLEPSELERALRLLGEVPDDSIMRLVKLLDGLPDDDVLGLVEALSRLSPDVRPPRHDADVGGRPHPRPVADPGSGLCRVADAVPAGVVPRSHARAGRRGQRQHRLGGLVAAVRAEAPDPGPEGGMSDERSEARGIELVHPDEEQDLEVRRVGDRAGGR